MREILYRAKAINRNPKMNYRTNYKNGDWVYGLVSRVDEHSAEMTNTDGVSEIDVDRETICEFTGLTTVGGKEIYENDICQYAGALYVVRRECDVAGGYWVGTGFVLDEIGVSDYMSFVDTIDDYNNEICVEIVGNIYDNVELLGGKQ